MNGKARVGKDAAKSQPIAETRALEWMLYDLFKAPLNDRHISRKIMIETRF